MATPTPTKTPSGKSKRSHSHLHETRDASYVSSSLSRFEAYNRLQAAAVAFGEKLPVPEIVALGGQSDGKSSLLEALGFRFNVREVEMGTRRPLILQMVHDPSALASLSLPEDSEEYGSPVVSASEIADIIKSRTEVLLKKTKTSVSPKPIVMRAEFAHCPNLTIIDTPGFVLKAKKGEPENTPDEILSMVKSLASPPSYSCSFSRVAWSGAHHCALPKERNTVSNDEFRRQISQVDSEVLRHLNDGIKGGYDEEKFKPYIGFSSLREYLESELQKRYKEAAPATLALLEQRCSEVNIELARMDSKIQATSDVSHLRKSAMMHAAYICNHVGVLIDGAADPSPEHWGKTTEEERSESELTSWPGVTVDIKPANAVLRLYGGAAFERVMHEFRCAAYSIELQILLAHAGRGGSRGVTEAAAEIARTAARSWLAPLLDTACDRLAFVLGNLFNIALERNRCRESEYGKNTGNWDGYVGFHAALRHAYNRFIKDLAKQCKQLVRHHLDSVTSPYSQVCYENDFHGVFGSSASSYHIYNRASAASFCLELSDGGQLTRDKTNDQENIPPESNAKQTTPGKGQEAREAHQENQMTVPETPSPDQPCDVVYARVKKELGNGIEVGPRKRIARMTGNRNNDQLDKVHNGGSLLFGNGDTRTGSSYSEICSSAAQHFARIREVLVDRSVTSTLNSGFLTPCRDKLVLAVGLDLFCFLFFYSNRVEMVGLPIEIAEAQISTGVEGRDKTAIDGEFNKVSSREQLELALPIIIIIFFISFELHLATMEPTPPLTPIPISRSETNPCPTTLQHNNNPTPSSRNASKIIFPIPPMKTNSPKKQNFKLYERRNSNLKNNLMMINTFLPSSGGGGGGSGAFYSPRNVESCPSLLDFPKLALSPVTPLNEDTFNKSSPSLRNSSEEDKAIAEKGFYLHPSPMSTPRDTEPQLLPLFPVTSPRVSGSSS
ncbi:Dynamin-related protein 5A [Hibiscus syriacus]|uniref:Dynamin-related protein 5A n=1 Tax=Hibiscus syriacus TaxID=106335 RepID=A0A6A3CQF4_HIBSY|nr:Dynamin-related protein 5A [Hibiscus syriacus]